MNLLGTTDFPSLCVEYISMISLIYYKIHCLYPPIYYLACDLIHLRFFEKH